MLNFSDALLSNARARASRATGYSQNARMGKTTYDCSSFVGRNLRDLGFNINPGITTANLTPDSQMMRKLGFQWIPRGQGFQAGDILWKKGHTEIYSGGRNTIGAHSTKNGVSEYDKQNLNSFAGGWRYVGDRFLEGAGTQGADRINPQGNSVSQPVQVTDDSMYGMADPSVQQAVAQAQPTVVLQMPEQYGSPAGFQSYAPSTAQTAGGMANLVQSQLGQLSQTVAGMNPLGGIRYA